MREGMDPGLVFTAASAYLGDDHEAIRVGMERLFDDLIGHMRAVKVAGVDVVHASVNCLSEYGNCTFNVRRRTPDLRACELHRSVAHAVYSHRGAGQREGVVEVYLCGHLVSPIASLTTSSRLWSLVIG